MTVPSTPRRAGPYTGTGSLVSYPFDFAIIAASDVGVTMMDATGVITLLVKDSSYLLTINPDQDSAPGGSVQYAVGGVATALPAGYTLTIAGATPFQQQTRLPQGGSYNAKNIEQTFDRIVYQVQQLAEESDRSIKLPLSDPAGTPTTLPSAMQRAGKLIGFDTITGAIIYVAAVTGSAVDLALNLASALGSSLVGYLQLGIGAVYRTVLDRLREKVSARDFGVVMDGSTPNRAAMNLFIAELNTRGAVNRFFGGVKGTIPAGTAYIEGALDPITSSNVVIEGDSHGGTVIYGGNACAWDLFTFDGSALALYNVGMANLRFYTPGNANAGACLRLKRTINSLFEGLHFMGHFDAIVTDGIAQTKLSKITCSQENRTAGTPRYSLDFQATSFVNSDVHVSGFNSVYGSFSSANSISIRGCDGIYFTNGHQFGATLVQPTGATCASVFWDDWYWDTSTNNNLKFQGTSPVYRGFHISTFKMRDSGGNALEVNAAVPVHDITMTNGRISEQRLYGVYAPTECDGTIGDVIFDTNNTDNVAGAGDVYCAGSMSLHDSRFQLGGVLGTAVQLTAASSDCHVKDNSFVSSTAGTKVSDLGTGNKIGGNSGFITKTTVPATINSGTNTVTVAHALGKTPVASECVAKYADAPNGGGQLWISAVVGANVTVRSENNVTANTGVYVTSDTEH